MTELALPLLYAIAGGLLIIEHLFPAHPLKPDWRWYTRAVIINAIVFGVFFLVEALWSKYANSWSVFSLSDSLSAPLAALAIYFLFTFVAYWWHRLRHHSPLIWRMFHQLHHSPQRLQTLTAYYIHPLDMTADLTQETNEKKGRVPSATSKKYIYTDRYSKSAYLYQERQCHILE